MSNISSGDTSPVVVSEENTCVSITLNQPSRLNALSAELVDELHQALDQALDHALDQPRASSARLVLFRAAGKGFSGGLDLSALDNESDGDLLLRLVRIEQLLQRVRHANIATAALVHGACYGAAADLVLACRTRIATADARFLMPGMRFGIVLGTRRLRDTVGERAAYQLLDRSAPFKADEALETGFITQIAAEDEWPQVIEQTLKNISGFSASAYAHRVASLTPDTRAADMNALVSSIADGSIRARMRDYVETVNAERQARKKS
jgi:enoyl-CoA hydratase/carnithine racemase